MATSGNIKIRWQTFVFWQKYKECVNGAANQKWNYTETKIFNAFYSTVLDQEITAANYASICTFCVTSTEKIDQPVSRFVLYDQNPKNLNQKNDGYSDVTLSLLCI